jgi:hypothetical protein
MNDQADNPGDSSVLIKKKKNDKTKENKCAWPGFGWYG